MRNQTERSNGIGSVGHDRFHYKPELERGQSSYWVQYQLFDHGRAFDFNHLKHIRYRGRTGAFDELHFLIDSHRLRWFIPCDDGHRKDIRPQYSDDGRMV
jgi:hypothetical protein